MFKKPESVADVIQMMSDIIGAMAGGLILAYSYWPEDKSFFVLPLIIGLISVAFERNLFMKILQVIIFIWIILIDRNLLINAADLSAKANNLWWLGLAYAFLNLPGLPKLLGRLITWLSEGWEKIRTALGDLDPT